MTASPACLSRQVGDFLPPRGACPVGRRLDLPLWYPAGGLPSLSPPYPALSLLSCPPIPPALARRALFPAGKGVTKVISCKGLRPLHPWG